MKNKVTALFVFMLATLVFYGGAGVNIVSYCCNHCRVAGIEAVIEDQCCEIHHHDHSVEEGSSTACTDGNASGCGMERLHFDWTSVQSLFPDLHPVIVDLWFVKALNLFLLPECLVKNVWTIASSDPPISCPRLYLSILTTLLI